jgi:DNA gyrase inhibitor GyrI
MKKIFKVFLAVLLVIALSFFGMLYYHDFFSSPQVVEKEMGPYTLVTKRFVGAYHKVGPTMDEVDSWLRENGVESTKGVGLYHDDPANVEESQLRSDVGNIVENVDEEVLVKIKEKFEVREIPKTKSAVIEFPIKSPLSYMIAPMKAYPALTQHWIEKGYAVTDSDVGIEIYDIPGKVTSYMFSIPQ